MRKNVLFFVGVALAVCCVTVFFVSKYFRGLPGQPHSTGSAARENKQTDDMEAAMKFEFLKTHDPALQYIPRERLANALTYVDAMRSQWQQRTTAFAWAERGPNNVGGRTRAIFVDKNDATGNTIFSGGVSGGLWKCTNFKNAGYAWTKINDKMDNLAITALAQDPTTFNTMYAGTGEGYFNFDAVRGGGIFKSTDGGATWNVLANTTLANSSDFNYVQDIVVTTGGAVYATTRGEFCNSGGVLKSTNGGNTWTRVIGNFTGGGLCSNANDFKGSDLEIAANGDLYATTGFSSSGAHDYGKIWKSAATLGANQGNAGQWTNVTPTPPAGDPGFSRIELACAPSNAQTLYALCQDHNSSAIRRLYKSTDGGTNWTEITPPNWCDQGVIKSDFTRNQAWYDLIAAFDPNNANNVLIGGIDVLKSTDGGSTFSQVSQWAGGCAALPYVHADIHEIEYINNSSNDLIIGCDGGLFYSPDGGTTFTAKNGGYNITQYYSAAIHPTSSNYFLGGTQDNGSHLVTSAGIGSGVEVSGGDGGFSHISQKKPMVQMTAYTNSYIRVTRNGWASAVYDNGDGSGRFINPSDYDDDAGILYSAAEANNLGRFNNIPAGTITHEKKALAAALGGLQISAVKVDPNTANRVWVGASGGGAPRVARVDNANGASPTATNFNIAGADNGSYLSNIDVEKGNPNHLLATFSNYGVSSIFESTDGGATWTNVEGNLPDIPVRWGIFLPSGSAEGVIALATEVGIFTTTATGGGATNWTANATGFPNVRTDMLQFRPFDNTLLAGTHGRGFFTSMLTVNSITWTGAVNNSWDNAGNWNPARVPTATDYVVIPSGAPNMPVSVTGTKACFNLTLGNNASITINSTLQVAGTLQNNGSIIGNGQLELNGNFNQPVSGTGSIAWLKLNNESGATVTNAIGNMQSITNVLEIQNGTLTTGNNITLTSTTSNTARVAPVLGTITGNVIVERYIGSPAARRAWRLLTSPLRSTTTNQFVYNHWQEGGANNAGFGTLVTGPGANPAVNGLDATSGVSLKKYSGNMLADVLNTRTEVLYSNAASAANNAFFIFVRGDRNPANLTIPNTNNTVLRGTGALQTGNQVFSRPGAAANAYHAIGNPYASPVDFDAVYNASTNINRRFYAWDPNINTVGGYVTIEHNGATYTSSVGASAQNQHIQNGQAVFMQTQNNGNTTIQFTETVKSATNVNNVFRGNNNVGMFRMSLYLANANNTTTIADGSLAIFHENYSAAVTSEDALKMNNIHENLALERDNHLLSIEKRKTIVQADTLFMKLWNTTQRNYILSFEPSGFNPVLQAWLVDKYLNTTTPLSVDNASNYAFAINADAASKDADRFMVVFRNANPLPFGQISIKGFEKENGIQVDWNVEREGKDVEHYEVEKSTNGRSFGKMVIVQPNQNNASIANYSWFDANAANGANYYRIKAVGKDGKINYSNVVKVVIGKGSPTFSVYPNPVKVGEAVTIESNNLLKGKYTLNIYNMQGQKVFSRTLTIADGSSSQSISIGKLSSGMYNMEMVNDEKGKWVKRLVIR